MSDAIDRAAEVLWNTSRKDEGTISYAGANIAARALDEAGLLASGECDGAEQRLSEFLCEMTGGLLSKTGYDVRTMVQAVDYYYQQCYDEDRAAHDRAVAARALREAAAAWMDPTMPRSDAIHCENGDVDIWLSVRADRIEREAGESDADA